jgi:hypothetical protein
MGKKAFPNALIKEVSKDILFLALKQKEIIERR